MIVLKILLFILLAILGIIVLVLVMPVQVEFSYISEKMKYKLKFAFINFFDSEGEGLLGSSKKKKKKRQDKIKNEIPSGDASGSEGLPPDEPEALSDASLQAEPAPQAPGMSEPAIDETSALEEEVSLYTDKTASDMASEVESDGKEAEEKPKKSLGEKVDFILGIWRSAKRPLQKILKGFHITDIYINFIIADKDAYDCAIKYGRINAIVYNILASLARIFTTKHRSLDIGCDFTKKKCLWDVSFRVRFLPITAVISGIWFLVTYLFRVYIPEKRKNRKAKKAEQLQNTQPQGGM